MALKDPKDLQQIFYQALTKLQGTDPITTSDRKRMSTELSDVYNYFSAVSGERSPTNLLHIASAQNAKIESQLAKERETLHEHQRFVENNFEKADQHLRTIQLSGYAVFFGLWSLTGDLLNPVWGAAAALLMAFSAIMFVIWEVCKSTILTFSLKRQASIGSGKIEEFLQSRVAQLTRDKSAVIILAKSRATAWMLSIIPAIAAVTIMLYQLFIFIISKGFFG